MCSSRSASSLCRPTTGMPVHEEITSSMSCRGDLEVAALVGRHAHPLEVLAQLDLPLAQVDGALEVLVGDRDLHLLDHLADLLLEPAQVLGVAHAAQLDPRAGLVDDVDRLVGQVAVGDVAARLVDRRAQRVRRGSAPCGTTRSGP